MPPAVAKVGGSKESRRWPNISDSHLQLKDLPARHRFLFKEYIQSLSESLQTFSI